MFTVIDNEKSAKIKVVGVGGAGGNAVNNMIEAGLTGVKFICVNTDAQALENSKAPYKLQLGESLTEGLGAGANPTIGRDAAMDNQEELRELLKDSHMVFITAGLGGGTGTGAAPVIAEICRELGLLTVSVVTRPFKFEGKKRTIIAAEGLQELRRSSDTVITISNDRLKGISSKNTRMIDAFKKADDVLLNSVRGITDLILMPGLINLDFADVRTAMSKAGMAIMGIGMASGENRAIEAAERAISHPLLEDVVISGAKGVLLNITCTEDTTLDEMFEASERIQEEVGDDAEIIFGTAIDNTLGDEIRVTVIATGINDSSNVINDPWTAKMRDIRTATTEAIPAQQVVNYNGPVFSTDDTGHAGSDRVVLPTKHVGRIHEDGSFEEMLDIPTFLRKKAD